MPTKEAKPEMETHPVTTEAKISRKLYKISCASYPRNQFGLFLQ